MYPPYSRDPEPKIKSKVLIASYCLTEDADRLGALIHPNGTTKDELIDLVFRNLATVHGLGVEQIKEHYTEGKGNCFAWDWLHDPLTMGWFFLSTAASTLLNGCYRRRAILCSGFVCELRHLRRITSARGWRQTLLRWRRSQCRQWVRGFIVDILRVLIQVRSTVASQALWTAHGVLLTNTSPSINPTVGRNSGGSGAELSTRMENPPRSWSS